jgi:hypothetical protein
MSNPTVNAGADQAVTDANVLVLTGLVSQGTYPLTYWIWTKDSGPDCAFTASTSAINQVYELSAGTYVFRFTAYDQLNNSSSDTVSVTVTHTTGPLYIPTGNSATVFDWFPSVDYNAPLGMILN